MFVAVIKKKKRVRKSERRRRGHARSLCDAYEPYVKPGMQNPTRPCLVESPLRKVCCYVGWRWGVFGAPDAAALRGCTYKEAVAADDSAFAASNKSSDESLFLFSHAYRRLGLRQLPRQLLRHLHHLHRLTPDRVDSLLSGVKSSSPS